MDSDLNKMIDNVVNHNHTINNNITFYKTKIIKFFPYETRIINSYSITSDKINDIFQDILKNEIDTEYAICLNDVCPSYDNKTSGYRFSYSISNELDSFSGKIFYLLGKLCDIDLKTNPHITPSRVIFMLGLFLFIIGDTENIQDTELKCIETITIMKKEKKTSIVFQTAECKDADELEKAIKRVFVFNPASSFSKKKFGK
ncbi:hypothetical protein Yalta_114 [Yalta virus]|nr:hypothetical protein Yalta_114 [Yalta virus]